MTEKAPGTGQQQYYIGLAVVAVTLIAIAWFFFRAEDTLVAEPEPTPVPTVQQPAPADVLTADKEPVDSLTVQAQDETPLQETPLDDAVAVEPTVKLPSLDNSDAEVKSGLLGLRWKAGLASLFVTEDMIRRFVVNVDNIAQGTLPKNQPLFQPMTVKFATLPADGGAVQLDPANFERYEPYLQLLESVSVTEVKRLFEYYYPLMQQAYAELGYPNAQFRVRLQEAIKVLLATPEVAPPMVLARPNVYYTYADPEIEALPLAQRQMIRLGPDNQKRLKRVLEAHQLVLAQP
ncbi:MULTISPECIES: DUF3014 domain-containing protein [Rheinheimera]|jgi:hypothetical protein|uniref:DUF3014 domain-containing protein n=1 Tax=Rheinheimera tangshanensis TaxID=400153 RepID=A0A5C8LWT6_9GAMM|nr:MULTISPECIES: DUF3014 domain-containing protein [Rheinheimera]KOO57454.1 hypothetical protein WH43_15540 [Rheinheimera sp. KL1]TXK79520.1 DUF3014 domain-containing protein [Rheinheimera tangshanensis]GGM50367.1 hypothetical protein GCM10010920_08410 [Rheinheimera tangshanensis]